MIKSIFSPMTASTSTSSATAVAVKLAKILNGQLSVCFMRPDPRSSVPYIGDGLTADVVQTICDATEKEGELAAREAADHVEKLSEELAVCYVYEADQVEEITVPSISMEVVEGFLKEKVGRMARVADLAVVSQPNDANAPDGEDMLHELIFGSGRPLMMVPEGDFKMTGTNVMIAWNGRAESARAVAAALPLLHQADKIYAATIGDEGPDRPGLDELEIYLKIHGLEMEAVRVGRTSDSIGKTLLETAIKHDADMLVSGAYSHSRWREKILGGVTKYLVNHAGIPIFLSH